MSLDAYGAFAMNAEQPMDPSAQDQAVGSNEPVSEILVLAREECLRLLSTNEFGRLAVAMPGGSPVIRPVNYTFDDRSQSVVFRTSDGSKLHAVLKAAEAAFEIDGVDAGSRTGWSVVVQGVAEPVTNPADVRHLDALQMSPWAPGGKRHWVRIRARTVTGRQIVHAARGSK